MKQVLVPAVIIMAALTVACQKNQAPVINSITAVPDSTTPNNPVTLTVSAEDPDGDSLTYTWSAASGYLSSTTGDTVTWTAPDVSGDFDVSVKAEDPKGLSDEASKTIKVVGVIYGHTTAASNDTIFIPDTVAIYDTIKIFGAPAYAKIDSCRIETNITHGYPYDLQIGLTSPKPTNVTLWQYNYPGGIRSIKTTLMNGEGVNGDWILDLWDNAVGIEGTINAWSIDIFWHY